MEGRATVLAIAGGFVLAIGYSTWWFLTPKHAYTIRSADGVAARLILDSPKVREMIASEPLPVLNTQPSMLVSQSSYVQLLEESQTKCADRMLPYNYARVMITSGPSRGTEGWLCSGRDFARTLWLE